MLEMSISTAGNSGKPARPRVAPGGLVTVAYMKARLDEGKDQLGIFMPLLFDVIPAIKSKYFVVADVQQALLDTHGVVMPLQAITTLLRRASKKQYVLRTEGSYHLNPDKPPPRFNVTRDKATLRDDQLKLGEALKVHGEGRGLALESSQSGVDLILHFLQEQQVAVLLGSPAENGLPTALSQREFAVVAEFLYQVIENDPPKKETLRGILEGLVLYHAAFLPNLSDAERRFKNLTVVFDSGLVRQALGYEGESPKILVRETIDILQSSGVHCVVFDKTVQEIHGILRMYEQRLGTQKGRSSLRAYPMARHFLTQRYAPSDVQEMSALLESEIVACGLKIVETPPRLPEFTHGESKLAERLADRTTQDPDTPRVIHDVDCVAGVLTLRRNHRSAMIEDARAVFVTTAPLVVTNTRLWWDLDEGESGVPPVLHVRSLTNLAWLKKPSISAEFQIRDLVALCAAAMRPSARTWQRFLVHLETVQSQNRLSPDQVTAIMVSAVSDKLLRDAELDQDDGNDIDAGALDEVVDRVMAKYRAEAQAHATEEIGRQRRLADDVQSAAAARIVEVQAVADDKVTQAEAKLGNVAEELRRRDLAIDRRSRALARGLTLALYWLAVALAAIGAAVVGMSHPFQKDWAGVLILFGIGVFLLLELVGVLDHLHHLRGVSEAFLLRKLRSWLLGQDSVPKRRQTPTIDDQLV
jgi:hypothetical protein